MVEGQNRRFFKSAEVTNSDLQKASEIEATGCPRRYCWWWRSLNFDWEIPAHEGCTWLEAEKAEYWLYKEVPCCRCDPTSIVDLYEPRGPQIAADGIDSLQWLEARAANRRKLSELE